MSTVFSSSSFSCALKSWSAFSCWNVACRFWPIITNVDRKIASSETTSVSVGHGLFSKNSIHSANSTMCT